MKVEKHVWNLPVSVGYWEVVSDVGQKEARKNKLQILPDCCFCYLVINTYATLYNSETEFLLLIGQEDSFLLHSITKEQTTPAWSMLLF